MQITEPDPCTCSLKGHSLHIGSLQHRAELTAPSNLCLKWTGKREVGWFGFKLSQTHPPESSRMGLEVGWLHCTPSGSPPPPLIQVKCSSITDGKQEP